MAGIVQKTLFWMDIAIPLLLCVTHGPGNLHMTKHGEVPNYSQEEFLSVGALFQKCWYLSIEG